MNQIRRWWSELAQASGLSVSGVFVLLVLGLLAVIAFLIGPNEPGERAVVAQPRLGRLDTSAALDLSSDALAPPPDLARRAGATPVRQGSLGTRTYIAPGDGAPGQPLPADTWVAASCKVQADDGRWWYRIASEPWNNEAYAPAGTFWNGDTPGQPPYRHVVDASVADC